MACKHINRAQAKKSWGTSMQLWGSDANMCVKRISIYLKIIASIQKLLNERSMVGIWIIHSTKEGEMSKHMDQVQDNPSIMCMRCSEYSVALNTIEREIVHHVRGNQVMQASSAKMQHTIGNHGNHVMCASSRHRQCTWHITSTNTTQRSRYHHRHWAQRKHGNNKQYLHQACKYTYKY